MVYCCSKECMYILMKCFVWKMAFSTHKVIIGLFDGLRCEKFCLFSIMSWCYLWSGVRKCNFRRDLLLQSGSVKFKDNQGDWNSRVTFSTWKWKANRQSLSRCGFDGLTSSWFCIPEFFNRFISWMPTSRKQIRFLKS